MKKTKRKLKILKMTTLLSLSLMCFSSCNHKIIKNSDLSTGIKEKENNKEEDKEYFIKIKKYSDVLNLHYEIIYDRYTKVMYTRDNSGRLTVIINQDGTPKLYDKNEIGE